MMGSSRSRVTAIVRPRPRPDDRPTRLTLLLASVNCNFKEVPPQLASNKEPFLISIPSDTVKHRFRATNPGLLAQAAKINNALHLAGFRIDAHQGARQPDLGPHLTVNKL